MDIEDTKPGNIQVAQQMQAAPFGGEPIFTAQELRRMPKGMRIMFDPPTREFFKEMAREMANPKNQMTQKHLKNDPQLCFAIIRRSLNWSMDPYEVASCTYKVYDTLGYYGKLVRGIMLNSGKVKHVEFEHGPTVDAWNAVEGNFKTVAGKRTDDDGNPIMRSVATYTAKDEEGLWIIATALMHDDKRISTPKILLRSCHPRNSTVWAYSPMTQIMEVASRRLANLAVPDAMMGATFDDGLLPPEPQEATKAKPNFETMQDVTPPAEDDDEREGDDDGPDAVPETEKPKRAPRMKILFKGKELGKTAFTRDLKQIIKRTDDVSDLRDLHKEFNEALVDQSEAHTALREDLNPLFIERHQELSGPTEEEGLEAQPDELEDDQEEDEDEDDDEILC